MMKEKLKKIFFPQTHLHSDEKADKQASVPDFDDFIELVLEIPERKFYEYALREDPIYSRMTADLKEELIADALKCGKEFAEKSLKRSPNIYHLLEKDQIHFSNPEMPSGGSHVIFAQYTEANHITVFQDSLTKFFDLLKNGRHGNLLKESELKELLIAHEYFHFLEYQNEARILTKNKKMQLWRIFRFRYMTRFVSLSEMSAMVFAKEYQSFPYSPFILDCLLTYAYSKEMSYELYKSIASL